MWRVKWFETESEAKKYQKEHGGSINHGTVRSQKTDHLFWALKFGFDPEKYPYTVQKYTED